METLVVNDKSRYVLFGGTLGANVETMTAHGISIMNQVNTIYVNEDYSDPKVGANQVSGFSYDIRISLVGMSTYLDADPYLCWPKKKESTFI